jgi:hypothetical protein
MAGASKAFINMLIVAMIIAGAANTLGIAKSY